MSAIFGPNECNIFGISRKKAIQYYYYYLFFITRLKLGKTNEKHKEKKNFSLSFLISILRKDCCMPKAFITSQ